MGVVTRWCAPGCGGRHIVVSGRQVPRAGQSGFQHRDRAGRSSLSEAQLWSETEKRGHLLTELGSLRDQRAQIAETFNMKNMEGTE